MSTDYEMSTLGTTMSATRDATKKEIAGTISCAQGDKCPNVAIAKKHETVANAKTEQLAKERETNNAYKEALNKKNPELMMKAMSKALESVEIASREEKIKEKDNKINELIKEKEKLLIETNNYKSQVEEFYTPDDAGKKLKKMHKEIERRKYFLDDLEERNNTLKKENKELENTLLQQTYDIKELLRIKQNTIQETSKAVTEARDLMMEIARLKAEQFKLSGIPPTDDTKKISDKLDRFDHNIHNKKEKKKFGIMRLFRDSERGGNEEW